MQNKKQFWQGVLLIFIVSAIAYLPLVKDLGYLNDDWYQMYDMQVKDPSFYHEIFAIDRPGRALAMIPLFSVFGFNPLWYHLSAFMLRVMGQAFRDRFNNIFDSMDDVANMPEPTFAYIHVISPHPPFVFDTEGNPTYPPDFQRVLRRQI